MDQLYSRIERAFRVRFAQIDGARVIYYPRYIEIIGETFPEATLDSTPFDVSIRFLQSNRLGDDIDMALEQRQDGWSVSGSLHGDHFQIELSRVARPAGATPEMDKLASFGAEPIEIGGWMCGPDGRLHLSRYYELISNTVEQWFESSLGMTFNELHVVRNFGVPTVQLDTRCVELPACGESVQMWLRPVSLGGSSVQLTTWLAGTGGVLLETKQVIVFVELNDVKIKTVRVPGQLREAIAAQLAVIGSE